MKMINLILLMLVSGCEPARPPECVHDFPKWGEASYVNASGTNIFLGVAMNLSRVQYRYCRKCNLEQRHFSE